MQRSFYGIGALRMSPAKAVVFSGCKV